MIPDQPVLRLVLLLPKSIFLLELLFNFFLSLFKTNPVPTSFAPV